jgi:hypothetical protein
MCDETYEGHVCNDRRLGHEGMHHDFDRRIYWVVRTDGSVDYLKEGPRS